MEIENYQAVVLAMQGRSKLLKLIDAMETQTLEIVDENGKSIAKLDDDCWADHFLEFFKEQLIQIEDYILSL